MIAKKLDVEILFLTAIAMLIVSLFVGAVYGYIEKEYARVHTPVVGTISNKVPLVVRGKKVKVIIPNKDIFSGFVTETSGYYVSTSEADNIVETIFRISHEKSIDPLLIMAIASVESKFKQYAISPKGAVGILQVMPSIHKDKIDGRDPFNLAINISVGVSILQEYWKYHRNLTDALLRYNGSLYHERQVYHTLVLKEMEKIKQRLPTS